MDKKQAEVEKELLKHEQKAFRELKASYNQALEDIKGRIHNLQNRLNELNMINTTGYDDRSKEILESMKQSKIYQLEFQKTLEKEINAVLDLTKQANVSNIQSFLTKIYQDSYLGIQYDINSKGIPIVTPMNPSLLVETVNKKTENMTFAQREIANMNDFKKVVKSEIARGIANASTYSQIAQQLSMKTNEALYKSKRIVRTEGCRVSTTAKLTSIRDEIEQGADLVKIWDSTLDGKTRPVHMELDGQVKEVDEPFEAGGYEVQGPGMFGEAGQDCNCRCVLLTKPRWDVSKKRIKWDNENNQHVATVNYETWKAGYYDKIGLNEYIEADIKITECGNADIVRIWEKYKYNIIDSIILEDDANYTSNYNNSVKSIFLNKNRPDAIIHELGHYIDFAIGGKEGNSVGKLAQIMQDDYINLKANILKENRSIVENKYQKMFNRNFITQKEYEDFIKNIDFVSEAKKGYEDEIQKILLEKYKNKSLKEFGDISDMLQALSQNKIMLGAGHSEFYFDNKNKIETEAFAEMFDATINNKKSLENIKELFPNAYEKFLKILEDIK